MNNKAIIGVSFLVGVLGGYAWAQHRIITLRDTLDELRQPPLKITPEDKWKNYKPTAHDEYTLTKAKRDWFSTILAKYIAPYVDKNVSTLLIEELIMPVEDRLIELESQQEALFLQKMPSSRLDD